MTTKIPTSGMSRSNTNKPYNPLSLGGEVATVIGTGVVTGACMGAEGWLTMMTGGVIGESLV